MSNLVFYVDVGLSGSTPMDCSSFDAVNSRLEPKPTDGVVLHPGPARNITMLLRQNSKSNTKIAAFDATVAVQTMHFTLHKQQFAAVMALSESLSQFTIRSRYRYIKEALLDARMLPSNCRPKGRAAIRLWWKYAFLCVRSDIKHENGQNPRNQSLVYRLKWRKNFAVAYTQRLDQTDESIEIDANMPGLKHLGWEDIQHTRQLVLEYRSKNLLRRSTKGLRDFILSKDRAVYGLESFAEFKQTAVDVPSYRRKHAANIMARMKICTTHFQFDLCSDVARLGSIRLDHPEILAVVREKYLSLQVEAWNLEVEDHCTENSKFRDTIQRFKLPQRGYSLGERVQVRQDLDWFTGHVSRTNGNGSYDITLDNELEKRRIPATKIRSAMFSLAVDAPPLDDALCDVYNVAMLSIKDGSADRLIECVREIDLVQLGFRGLKKVEVMEVAHNRLMIISVYSNSKNAANSSVVGNDKKTPLER